MLRDQRRLHLGTENTTIGLAIDEEPTNDGELHGCTDSTCELELAESDRDNTDRASLAHVCKNSRKTARQSVAIRDGTVRSVVLVRRDRPTVREGRRMALLHREMARRFVDACNADARHPGLESRWRGRLGPGQTQEPSLRSTMIKPAACSSPLRRSLTGLTATSWKLVCRASRWIYPREWAYRRFGCKT